MARKAKRVKRVTKKEQKFVARKIRKARKEGISPKQAVGRAFGMLRQRRKKRK